MTLRINGNRRTSRHRIEQRG